MNSASILVTDPGITIEVREEQPANALVPIVVKESGTTKGINHPLFAGTTIVLSEEQ